MGFSGSSAGKEPACNAGDPSSIPGSGRSAGEGIGYTLQYSWASLLAQLVKNPPARQETWVQSLSWEDPLEKGKATHASIPEEFHGLYSPWGCKESDTTEQLSLSNHYERCPYKERKFEHQECSCTKKRPCEDTHLQPKKRGRPQKKPNWPTSWSWASSLQHSDKTKFCCLIHSSVFCIAALAN